MNKRTIKIVCSHEGIYRDADFLNNTLYEIEVPIDIAIDYFYLMILPINDKPYIKTFWDWEAQYDEWDTYFFYKFAKDRDAIISINEL